MPIVKTPNDLGQLIRSKRKSRGWDQAALAKQIGVSRQWVIDIEKGKPRAELALVLRALQVLGLNLQVDDRSTSSTQQAPTQTIDLNSIVDRNRGLQGLSQLGSVYADFMKNNATSSLADLARPTLPDYMTQSGLGALTQSGLGALTQSGLGALTQNGLGSLTQGGLGALAQNSLVNLTQSGPVAFPQGSAGTLAIGAVTQPKPVPGGTMPASASKPLAPSSQIQAASVDKKDSQTISATATTRIQKHRAKSDAKKESPK